MLWIFRWVNYWVDQLACYLFPLSLSLSLHQWMKILHELTAISREESSVFVILNAQQEGEKMIDNTLAEGLEIFLSIQKQITLCSVSHFHSGSLGFNRSYFNWQNIWSFFFSLSFSLASIVSLSLSGGLRDRFLLRRVHLPIQ